MKVCATYVIDLITLTQFDLSANVASDETNEETLSCNPNTKSEVEMVNSQIVANNIG